jgi:chromosome segregation ATPase
MTDIVERLEDYPWGHDEAALAGAAILEIVRLRAERDEARGDFRDCYADLGEMTVKFINAEAERDRLRDALENMQASYEPCAGEGPHSTQGRHAVNKCIDKDCMRAGSADAGSCVNCQLVWLEQECEQLQAECDRLREALALYREAVVIDVKMEGPRFMGANSSALKRAWDHDRAALKGDTP